MEEVKLGGTYLCSKCGMYHNSMGCPNDVSLDFKELIEKEENIQTPRFFTLTAEEVEIVRKLVNKGMDKLGHEIKFNRINPDFFKNAYVNNLFKKEPLFKGGEKILSRIKQFQDENKIDS